MSERLKDKVAIVTGAARGIGQAFITQDVPVDAVLQGVQEALAA